MSLTLLIIDSRASYFGAEHGARSLLSLPVGVGSVLDHIVSSLGGLNEREILVTPAFPPTPTYEQSLRGNTTHRLRMLDYPGLTRRLHELETSDYLFIVESRQWSVEGYQLGAVKRCLKEYRGAAYGIAVGGDPEGTRELVECDDFGLVKRVQRFYNAVSWPEHGNTGIVFALVPARALAGIRPTSLSKVRGAMASRGLLGWDIPLVSDVLDISNEGEFLAVQERALSESLEMPPPPEYAVRSDGVLIGQGCRIAPSARLVAPLVVQAGAVIGEGAAVVGPAVIGPDSRIGDHATIAQSVVGASAEIPSGAIVRHRVVTGACPSVLTDADPQVQFSFSAAKPMLSRRYSGNSGPVPGRMEAGTRAHRIAKRVFDLILSAISLIVLSPLLLLVTVLIKLESGGPVFFAHRRERRGGTEFPCVKFRTMVVDAHRRQRELQQNNEVDGPQFKMREDPRVTRVGYWLRATNLDELPQLFNVLVGQMSLVGPRPSPFRENQICVPWRRARLSVRPGITGLWQICRDDDRASGDFHQWIYYDITYVRNFSFWLDIKILVATVLTLGGRWAVPLSWMVRRRAVDRGPAHQPAVA